MTHASPVHVLTSPRLATRNSRPGACQHMKGAQDTICLDSLRSILVCLYSLMFSEAIIASSLMGLLGPKTDYEVNDDEDE